MKRKNSLRVATDGNARLTGGLYLLALERLKGLEKIGNSKIIRFPQVFEKVCSTFSITKQQCWELLFIFRDFGFVEIVPHQGVRILSKNLE